MSEFDDIRPYNDSEVVDVLARLISDSEFIDLLLSRRAPLMCKFLPWLFKPVARPLLRRNLRKLTSDVKTVADFQAHMTTGLKNILDRTTDGYSFAGLDQLDADKTYLFMGNHRDIALDPAMVNLALYSMGLNMVRIAIGDNLLQKPFATDLIRVNRSFIVKRSATGRRDKLEALKRLSAYIRHSVVDDKVSCWIAQAEGRAKDGRDRTETALLKMLALSKAKQQDFGAAITQLNIMPVAVSYEYDPCIAEKVQELFATERGQAYIKDEFEDLDSIQKGFVGYKGRICVNFADPISGAFANADDLAAEIDRRIHSCYQLFPTNIIAWQMQGDKDKQTVQRLKQQWPEEDWPQAQRRFEAHIASLPSAHRRLAMATYAAPVDSQLAS